MTEGPYLLSKVRRDELQKIFPALDLPPVPQPIVPGRAEGGGDPPNTADEIDRHILDNAIDNLPGPLTALCLSGGGIRSASFALGAIQAMARFGLLEQFHYLSTVSGGGYIGGWLSAWRHHARDDPEVFERLNDLERKGREAAEITGIRANSNYLTPRLGLFSADTWTVIALYIRNLLLNWLVFGPFFMAVLFVIPLAVDLLQEAIGFGPVTIWTLLFAGAAATAAGLSVSICGRLKKGKWRLNDGTYLVFAAIPIFAGALCFSMVAATERTPDTAASLHLTGAIAGAVTYGLAWLIAIWVLPGRGALGPSLPHWLADFVTWICGGALAGWVLFWGFDLTVAIFHDPNLIAIFGFGWVILSNLIGELLYVGLSSRSVHGDMDREWLARSAGWLSAIALLWGALAAIGIYGPETLRSAWHWLAGIGGVSGLVTILLGSSARTAALTSWKTVKGLKLTQIVSLAAFIFALFLAAVLSLTDQQLISWLYTIVPSWPESVLHALAGGTLAVLAIGISFFVNVNRFSLHAVYRNRLIRAFLGSARAGAQPPRTVTADPFTSFDPGDNPEMKDLVTRERSGAARLLHIVNMALNVVSSSNLAWQERQAESFTVSPLASGNPNVGYRDTAHYGGHHIGLTLGTAVAISGAAVSPNQGYHSSRLVGFLLMLFNVRLGWWLGNPKFSSYREEGPRLGLRTALAELAGLTTDDGRWIYLSDGGHFENLGIYEMVRRRCRIIVVSDAGSDPECAFEDLGNAVRKSFVDLGVSINFKTLEIQARQNPPVPGVYCAIGHIVYPGSKTPGWLVYVKPGYHGTEPADIRSYAQAHPNFPHESTTDQWFSESQLESYRALGAHVFEKILTAGRGVQPGDRPGPLDMEDLIKHVTAYLSAKSDEIKREKSTIATSIEGLEESLKTGLSSIGKTMRSSG